MIDDRIYNLDVLDTKTLAFRWGYNPNEYYCGNYSFQKYYSSIMRVLKKLGMDFPFNPACFKHDKLYSARPTLVEKIKIDYMFFKDMMKILNNYQGVADLKWLKMRMIAYYFIVVLFTPLYIFQGKVKNK
jgi:hypothetical protein